MLSYQCQFNDEIWNSSIVDMNEKIDYTILEIEGKSSRIITYIGKNDEQYWCCFPEYELSSGLSYPDDVFWNIEKLQCVFHNPYDAVTVTYGIKAYYEYRDSVSEDIEKYISCIGGRIYTNKVSVILYDRASEIYHLLFKIRRNRDECMMLSIRIGNGYYDDMSSPMITQLNYYFGHCHILKDSPYIGTDIDTIIKKLKKRRTVR